MRHARREPSRQSRQLVFVVVTLGLAATFTAAGGWTGLAGRDMLDEGGERGGETAMKVVPSVPEWDPSRDPGLGTQPRPGTTGTTGAPAKVTVLAAAEPSAAGGATTVSSVSLVAGASAAPVAVWRPKLLDRASGGPPTATTVPPTTAVPVTTSAAQSPAPTTTTAAGAPDVVPTTTSPPTTTTTLAPAAAVETPAPSP